MAPQALRYRDTLTEQFLAFDAAHPHVFTALERFAAQQLAAGATRMSMKALFETLRWHNRVPGVHGLNNNYTAFYARKLLARHPDWAGAFELRRQRTR